MKVKIKICMGSSCFQRGNGKNLEFIQIYLEERGCSSEIELVGSRCEEMCRKGPNLEINGIVFHGVTVGTLPGILDQFLGECSCKEDSIEAGCLPVRSVV
ncbi:MAG TPA: (2Fe-2S) ferredoxin domain-containing protein [Geobacteraceae bacterium]|nr:(2Fe-2S) ferredoxin domain-containing protein [Geobacteraceae bacterium]